MAERSAPAILWPEWFDMSEELIYQDKGYFEAEVRLDDRTVSVTFYDPTRLAQDIATEIKCGTIPVFQNLVVLSEVNRKSMQSAVERIAEELE